MEFLKRFKEKLAYDLSSIALTNRHKRNSFSGDILYISATEKLIDIPAEIVYLTKNGFIIHLIQYSDDKYIVTIYFKPSQLDEVKFYINSLNKKL